MSSGLAGLVVAAGIMLMWLLVGRGLVAGGKAVAVVPQTVAAVGGGAPEAPKESVKDAPPKDPIKDAPSKDTGMGDVPPKDTGMGDVTPKDPIKDAPPKDTGMSDAPKKPDADKPAPPPAAGPAAPTAPTCGAVRPAAARPGGAETDANRRNASR